MVMDEFGNGHVVQHSLFETNGDWHMSRALDHFLRVNPDSSKKLQVIVVDKDLNEIKVLQSYFPDGRVLICLFHVLKYIKLKSRSPDYGKISAEGHTKIDHLVHNMVYAASKEDFELQRESLEQLCGRIGFAEFYGYMEKNWFQCQDMWVMYKRARLPHFKNHTNNRLENFFGKLKKGVTSYMSMSECLIALFAMAARQKKDYTYKRNRIGRNFNVNYDREMNQVLHHTTFFVAEQIEKEYTAALRTRYTFDIESVPGSVVVVGEHSSHTVDLRECDCSFAFSMKLPCRHSIAYRAAQGNGSPIPLNRIDSRYCTSIMHVPSVY